MERTARNDLHQRQARIERRAKASSALEFFNVLTSADLLDMTEALQPEHRERMYTPTVTMSMFMRQALEEDSSCQRAVDGWAAQRVADGLSPGSVGTGGYCRARQRLPVELVSGLSRETARQLGARAQPEWRWRGRSVKLVDGTTVSMPDTPENQAHYPQPDSQARGVGFPMARVVAVICLATGAVLDAAMGPYSGKGTGELALLRTLGGALSAGDVMLADALYCDYFLVATLAGAGVDVLFEQHGSRITDFRRGRSLGTRDHLVEWHKPRNRPHWMTPEQYAAYPDTLKMRETKVAHKVLVTTMLDHRATGKDDLAALYKQRWNVELDLRNIKSTMAMDVLHCQSPQMNEKELWVYLLAYNVIRLLMAQAANDAGLHPRELSFKHTVQIWTQWVARGLSAATDDGRLFKIIAMRRVGNRPGRIEPRMRKRRPKAYPWLKEPRAKARQNISQNGHP